MNRGMTLLEVLVSVVLLGALSIAAAGLVSLGAAASPEIASRSQWLAAANSTLDSIARNLDSGDLDTGSESNRMHIVRDVLWISTRSSGVTSVHPPGPVRYGYRFDREAGFLSRDEHSESPAMQATRRLAASRPLLGHAANWSIQLDKSSGRLSVTIQAADGQIVTRSFRTR